MSTTQRSESMNAFFDGYVHAKTSLKEFVDQYEAALSDKYEKESQANFVSFNSTPFLKTRCVFERQMANVYTRAMFLMFQEEVYSMPSCSKTQVRVDGQITTFAIKERVVDKDGKLHTPKAYEILFIKAEIDVYCICRLFQHKGILCRHVLYVLNEFVDEIIPSHYILPRWRKDFKHKYVESCESLNFEASKPVQRYGILYPCTIQILEEGASSESKFKTVLGVLQDLKRKLVDESNNSYSVEDELVGTLPSESPESVQPGYVKFLNPLQAKLVGRLKGRLLSELEKNWKSTTKKQKVLPTVTTVPKSGNHKATNKNISCHDTCGNEHNITSNQFQENMSMDDTFGGSANKFFDNNNVLGLRSGYEDGTFASYPPGFFTSQLLEPRQLNNASGQHHFPQLFLPEQCSQAPHAFPSTNNDGAIPLSSQFDLNKSQWVSSDN